MNNNLNHKPNQLQDTYNNQNQYLKTIPSNTTTQSNSSIKFHPFKIDLQKLTSKKQSTDKSLSQNLKNQVNIIEPNNKNTFNFNHTAPVVSNLALPLKSNTNYNRPPSLSKLEGNNVINLNNEFKYEPRGANDNFRMVDFNDKHMMMTSDSSRMSNNIICNTLDSKN